MGSMSMVWQHQLLDQLTSVLASQRGVIEILPHGSFVDGKLDEWSDLDVQINVTADWFPYFFPETGWIADFGDIYALNQSHDAVSSTTRVVFRNGTRLDLRFPTTNSTGPERNTGGPPNSLAKLENDVRFESFLAASKIARNDLLIGTHLTLELERKALVVAMLLRDRNLGTSAHRFGGLYNDAVDLLGAGGTDAASLIRRIRSASEAFGTLAVQLDPSWTPDWEPLYEYLARVVRTAR
jgi:hypothetical protein